jgi:tripartite-type tricarboxylate transporter receptor subunit TctC
MNITRRRLVTAGATALALPCGAMAQSDAYPSRPVTLILPAGAGTGVDILGRLGAQKLGELIGQRVVVENVVGASGVIGVQRVTRAKPDGYTLLFTFNQTITMNPHVVANLPYDPEKELDPVSRFAESPFVWMVNDQVPVKTFAELIAHAKANPGRLAMGVTGFASAAYLGAQLLAHQTGAEVLPVNYAGNFSADLMSGVVQLSMSPAAQVPGMLATGKVRALAQTGARRAPGLSDVPTVSEHLPGYVIDAWYGVWTPKGTPKAIVTTLTNAWRKVAALPDVVERLEKLSAIAVGSTAEELGDLTRRETRMWGDVVKARNIKPAQ